VVARASYGPALFAAASLSRDSLAESRRAAGQTAVRAILGITLAGLLVQTLQGGRADPRGRVVLVVVTAMMALICVIATLGPARRAQYSPTEALEMQ
jgi:hypothetical protein